MSLASFNLECEGEQGSRPGVGEVLAGVVFEFAKAVVDGVAVDVELLGSCLGGTIAVEPGLEGFHEDGSLFVGEPGESDHKSRLQEESVRLGRGVPRYELQSFGPDHARRYLATVYVAGQRLGMGEGRSKKDAEQVAAQVACESLEVERGGGDA